MVLRIALPAPLQNMEPLLTAETKGLRVIEIGKSLLNKAPARPSHPIARTIIWIKDVIHFLYQQIYYLFHKRAIDQARGTIHGLLKDRRKNREEIKVLSRPFAKTFADFAYYLTDALEDGDREFIEYCKIWEMRGFALSPHHVFGEEKAFFTRPLFESFVQCSLFDAPLYNYLTGEEIACNIVDFAKRELTAKNANDMANLLEEVLPLVYQFEGIDPQNQVIIKLRGLIEHLGEMVGASDLHPTISLFKDKIFTGALAVLLQQNWRQPFIRDLFEVLCRRALTVDQPDSRAIVEAFSEDKFEFFDRYAMYEACREGVLIFLENNGKEPKDLLASLVLSQKDDAKKITMINEILSLQLKSSLAKAEQYNKDPKIEPVVAENYPIQENGLFLSMEKSANHYAISYALYIDEEVPSVQFSEPAVIPLQKVPRRFIENEDLLLEYLYKKVFPQLIPLLNAARA